MKSGNGQKMRQPGTAKQVIDRLFDMAPLTDQQRGGDPTRRPVHGGGDFISAALTKGGQTNPPVQPVRWHRQGRTA